MDVATKCFFQQPQDAVQRTVGRQTLHDHGEVSREGEDEASVCLCFEERQVGEERFGLVPPSGGNEVDGQVMQLVLGYTRRGPP